MWEDAAGGGYVDHRAAALLSQGLKNKRVVFEDSDKEDFAPEEDYANRRDANRWTRKAVSFADTAPKEDYANRRDANRWTRKAVSFGDTAPKEDYANRRDANRWTRKAVSFADTAPKEDYANRRDANRGTRKAVSFADTDRSSEFGQSDANNFRLNTSDVPNPLNHSDKQKMHVTFGDQDDNASGSESETSASEEDFEQSDSDSEVDDGKAETDGDYSGMSMEALLKLQEEIGIKAFREKVLNVKKSVVRKVGVDRETSFKRLNKNRPSEMPLMRKRVRRMNFLEPGKVSREKLHRDPRFDDLSGDLQMDLWDERYKFLKDTRKNEMDLLLKELKKGDDVNHKEKRKIKHTLQRMKNQHRESMRRDREVRVSRLEKKHQREALRKGMKPKYMSEKEKKLLLKTMQFDQLKKENKVGKYMQRKEKRQLKKEKMQISNNRRQ